MNDPVSNEKLDEMEISIAMSRAGGLAVASFFRLHPFEKLSEEWEANLAASVYYSMRQVELNELVVMKS